MWVCVGVSTAPNRRQIAGTRQELNANGQRLLLCVYMCVCVCVLVLSTQSCLSLNHELCTRPVRQRWREKERGKRLWMWSTHQQLNNWRAVAAPESLFMQGPCQQKQHEKPHVYFGQRVFAYAKEQTRGHGATWPGLGESRGQASWTRDSYAVWFATGGRKRNRARSSDCRCC